MALAGLAKLQNELTKALAKRDAIHAAMLNRYKDGSATRARTTTGNARVDWVNEEIMELRAAIAKAKTARRRR